MDERCHTKIGGNVGRNKENIVFLALLKVRCVRFPRGFEELAVTKPKTIFRVCTGHTCYTERQSHHTHAQTAKNTKPAQNEWGGGTHAAGSGLSLPLV